MVKEMRAARAAQLLPKLVAKLDYVGMGQAFVTLYNVGLGPAMRVSVAITFEPKGRPMPFSSGMIMAQERIEFFGTNEEDQKQRTIMVGQMIERYTHLRMTGLYYDVLGGEHRAESVIDIRDEWEKIRGADPVSPHRTELARFTSDLKESLRKIESSIDRLKSPIDSIARGLRERKDDQG
jgi:hypothetical protein